jgi:chromosome segregation ATPase
MTTEFRAVVKPFRRASSSPASVDLCPCFHRRKELWKEAQEAKAEVDAAHTAFSEAKRAFGGCMAPDLFNGLENLEKLVKEAGIQGVFGPLVDLVTCQNKYMKPAEVRQNM